jgi:hypothetical protein
VGIALRLFSKEGDRRYDPRYDVNDDGRIDVRDLFIALKQFGRKC